MDEIITFVGAGAETTSNFLTMILLLIYERPSVLSRLREEISSVIKSDADMTIDNFKKLKYLDCIINETSRYFYAGAQTF